MRVVRLHHVLVQPVFDVLEDGEIISSGPAQQESGPLVLTVPAGVWKAGSIADDIERLRGQIEEQLNAPVAENGGPGADRNGQQRRAAERKKPAKVVVD